MIEFWNTSRGRVAAEFQTTWTTMLWRSFLLLTFAASAIAQKPAFTVGWSVYAGWTPYHYLNKSGILRKWADKYGITIKVQRFDYAPSLDAFVAKNIDACTMTNMEALDMPAASGVPTTAIVVGDYSNGNDALLVRNGLQNTMHPLSSLTCDHCDHVTTHVLIDHQFATCSDCGATSRRSTEHDL